MAPAVSIVIPVYNAAPYLTACLDAIRALDPAPLECILVDDGSTDGSAGIAKYSGFPVLSAGIRRGPAAARNLGALAARGEILLFVDADVVVPSGVMAQVCARFEEDPGRAAVIGSYDDRPASLDFVSQYRNLLHCYTHQTGRERTCAFWTGCGAIRGSVFRAHGGFSEAHAKPYLEDIELGLRLRQSGCEIWLDKQLQVTHLKRLSFWGSFRTDLCDRAIPWTRLILQFRSLPADLNLRWTQRLSVALAGVSLSGLAAAACLGLVADGGVAVWSTLAVTASALALTVGLNRDFYQFLAERRGAWFAVRAFPLHWLYFFSSGLGLVTGLLLEALGNEAPATSPEPTSTEH